MILVLSGKLRCCLPSYHVILLEHFAHLASPGWAQSRAKLLLVLTANQFRLNPTEQLILLSVYLVELAGNLREGEGGSLRV